MRVVLDAVAKGRRDGALPLTSLEYETGRATLAEAETEQRPTVLGLIASGRMRPDTGRIRLERTATAERRRRGTASSIRRSVALVDAPGVSEPEPDITLAGVAAEELMFAGRRSDPLAVRRWLDEQGLGGEASVPIANVAPARRVRALCELAVLREGVEGLVLVSPDRHGGEPDVWWRIAEEFADRGYAVLVIAGRASHTALEGSPVVQRAEARSTPVVERGSAGDRDETRRTPMPARPRLRRLTAPTKGGRA